MRFLDIFLYLIISLIWLHDSYAIFKIEPTKININLQDKMKKIKIINGLEETLFSLEIIDKKTSFVTKDFSIKPQIFTIKPNENKIIRIITKKNVNYVGKNYLLHIKSDDDLTIDDRNPSYTVPINIVKEKDSQDKKESISVINNSQMDVPPGLTQIKINVPVRAVIY